MNEWLYPVNDHSDNWGYKDDIGQVIGLREFMKSERVRQPQIWTLPRKLNGLAAGDLIWVRGTSPLSAVVAMGEVFSSPRPGSSGVGWDFDVSFDNDQTRQLAHSPLPITVDSIPQSVRSLSERERRQIVRKVAAPKSATETEGRLKRLGELTVRQGQSQFRQSLMLAYGSRCAITGCDVEPTLQAAHIRPYNGPSTNRTSNGLLLRGDIHNLFDRGLIWITDGLRVGASQGLNGSEYAGFRGTRLRVPRDWSDRPDPAALAVHRNSVAER